MHITRNKLVDKIHERLDGAVPKLLLCDAVDAISKQLIRRMVAQSSISIANFATLHVVQRVSGDYTYLTVCLRPHRVFRELLKEKRARDAFDP